MEKNTLRTAQLIVQLKVEPEDWQKFILMISALKDCVKAQGPENVLIHEVHYQEDTFNCLMIESYKNEQAMLQHLQLADPISNEFKINWTINRIELLGDCSPRTVELWKQATGNGQFSYYNNVILS